MVKRYEMSGESSEGTVYMPENFRGGWVEYGDYAALQAENERLKVEIKVTEDNLAFAMRTISEIEIEVMALIDAHKGE